MNNIISEHNIKKIYAYSFDANPTEIKIGQTGETDVWGYIESTQANPRKTPSRREFTLHLNEPAFTEDSKVFTDTMVLELLEKRGFKRFGEYCLDCNPSDIKSAILTLQTGVYIEGERNKNYKMRPEQEYAVSLTSDYFIRNSIENIGKPPHFLWNAKMRFGKTFTSYQLALKMGWTRVMVLTFKPAVEESWRNDLLNHVDFKGWQFLGKNDSYDDIDESKPLVWFVSFMDLKLKGKNNGAIKEKFELLYADDWDCIILDEYHFGAWNDSSKEFYSSDNSEQNPEEQDFDEETFQFDTKSFLYLSGTPFRALNTGEFLEDQIFNWTYMDEQRAKYTWNEDYPNPYLSLPKMVLMTYQMPDELRKIAEQGEINEFDLNEFFKTEEKDNRIVFKYESYVQKWLNLIRGEYLHKSMFQNKPPLPFDDSKLLNNLLHTFWFLPNVNSCYAMKDLLQSPANQFYHDYKIVVAAGVKAGVGLDAIPPVQRAIDNGINTKTITLSCGKLTTGVTIPQWSGILILRNLNSAETYFQSIFRVQSPWIVENIDRKSPDKEEIIKEICYVFDFAPNRALRLISEYSCALEHQKQKTEEEKIEDFIKFLPVLCYDGNIMQELKPSEVLDIVAYGTSSTLLAKKWQSNRMVNMDNAILERLLNSDVAMTALSKITAFRNLNEDLTKIISSEKSLKKTKKTTGGKLDKSQKKEESDNRKKKDEIRKKLLKFITRIPHFMYLTDHREETLTDVIRNIEPNLFTIVTGLQIKDFDLLVELGVFNREIMNSAIFSFRRFENPSLEYAGNSKVVDKIGGFDIVKNN